MSLQYLSDKQLHHSMLISIKITCNKIIYYCKPFESSRNRDNSKDLLIPPKPNSQSQKTPLKEELL